MVILSVRVNSLFPKVIVFDELIVILLAEVRLLAILILDEVNQWREELFSKL